MSLCIASAGVLKSLSIAAFTLAWTHSIAKVEWQEDWRLSSSSLELVQARVKGTGPGMEPPPEARLVDGWFRWQPDRPLMPALVLANSGAAGEWRLCEGDHCRTLSEIVGHPIGMGTATLTVCHGTTSVSPGQ
jgi:hypothetical protein